VARSEKSRPLELVGVSVLIALVFGATTFVVTNDVSLTAIISGVAFVVTILVLAMLVLATSPQLPPRSRNPHDS
jgi:hypothetical protein